MRKALFFAIATMMMTSCTTLYVQQVNVKSDNLKQTTAGYEYQDQNIAVSYNFWSEGGDPGFVVQNLTEQIIYVDLSKSFYVSGGVAHDYFRNRTYSSSSSYVQNVAESVSGTILGRWWPSGALGSKTASVTASDAKGTTNGISFGEKPVVAIPPHASKIISEYAITTSPFQDCSIKLFPGNKDNKTFYFDRDNAPRFSNNFVYRVGEKGEDVLVKNDFYISGFTNQQYDDATDEEEVGCKKTKKVTVYKNSSPSSFYILYDNKTNNRYSADAKSEPGL